MKRYNKLITVIIVNYNNRKLISRSIHSIKKQTYKNIELILVDDFSNDGSYEKAKKFKDIKILRTKKKNKLKYGSMNQMNAYYLGAKKSKGDIIFFLDSDDYFYKSKIEYITKQFNKDSKLKIIFDNPKILLKNNKKYVKKLFYRNKYFVPWPQYPPQSCISVNKKYFLNNFNKIKINKFLDVWLDFRLVSLAIINFKKIKVLNKNLTYYDQSRNTISSSFKKFSKTWWKRRSESHKFYQYLLKKFKKKSNISLDYIITNFIDAFI